MYYGANYLTIPLSILLSENYSVDKMILSYDSENMSNNFLSDFYSVSENEVYIPWAIIKKKNKYWDLSEIIQDVDKFKQEHGL